MTPSPADVDVAVVGGGVAGAALAIVLARAGVRVAMVERERHFRDRVRGEALMPWGAAIAGELGIAEALPQSGARPLPIWQTYVEREPRDPYNWRDDVPSGDVLWGVSHAGLQERLLCRAGEAGVVVLRPAKARRVSPNGRGRLLLSVETKAGTRTMGARLIVGADGSASGVRSWIGAKTVRDPVDQVIGGVLIEGIDLDPDAAHIASYSGGRAMIFRQASGRTRVYVVARAEDAPAMRGPGAAEAMIARSAAALPEGALARARVVGPAAVFPGADIFANREAGEGIVLIGDAASANDPTQGHGLSLAFKDVRELSARLLTRDDWQAAIDDFAARRPGWYEPLRAHAMWAGPLVTGVGPEADAARTRAERAAEFDPLRGGYGAIHALGPDGLPVTDAARRHFLGEDLEETRVTG